MNCLNCRSDFLENWLYCPKCGKPTSLSIERSTGVVGGQVSATKILENLTVGVLHVDARGRIGQINAAARVLFDIQGSKNLLGKPYGEFIRHEACGAIIQRHLIRGFQPATSDESEDADKPDEITLKDKDNEEYIFQVLAVSVYDDANALAGVVFTFQDITQSRNVERMKAEFVSIVSHELRTPLVPMKGFIRTLLDDEKEEWYDRETRREFYTIIDENVDRSCRLISDLLDPRPIGPIGPRTPTGPEMNWEENVGLRKATEEVVATQRRRTDKHTFVIDFEPEEIKFETDPDKIQSILHNFVSNAIKFSMGGEIRIIARLKPGDEEFPHESVLLGVKDHGKGMTPASIKKIGKPFKLAKNAKTRKAGGTGIGLYLVKALIEAHKGIMTVESELGKGSTFWVRLPLSQGQEWRYRFRRNSALQGA